MEKARFETSELIKGQEMLKIFSPYNQSFIDELKAQVPYKGRKWDSDSKCWTVVAEYIDSAKEVTRRYFDIEGEEEAEREYEVIEAKISGGNTSKRSYPGGVTVDGCDLINMGTGQLVNQSPTFEIVEKIEDGFDSYFYRHAFSVKYQVKVRCRKDAKWEIYGNAHNYGKVEILSRIAA